MIFKSSLIAGFFYKIKTMKKLEIILTEFGAKINLSEVNGFCRIDRLNWEAYNESIGIQLQVYNYYNTYGFTLQSC